jgi:prepilin-type N-terminal cleavage/methylation domain-containing protein
MLKDDMRKRRLKEKVKSLLIRQKGFTLIELAIVLVILGLLLGTGTGIVGMLTKRAKLYETRNIIKAGIESLISYSASNNSLPDLATFPTVVGNPNDVWGKSLYYITDDDLTDSTSGGICGRKTTQLKLSNCTTTGCGSPVNTVNNVAFIIVSGSTNFNNQTIVPVTNPVTSDETVNHYSQGLVLDDYTTDMNRAEPYDDVVKWVTLDELRIKAGCEASQIRIVNNELPYGYQGSSYSASIFGDGGVPFADSANDTDSELDYKWCWEDDPINGAPTNVTFMCGINPLASSTCSLAGGTWQQCTSMSLGGTPTVAGSYGITFFVRDENDDVGDDDNIAQRAFVLTLHPASSGCYSTCTDFSVWNNLGNNYDFLRDGACNKRNDGNEITNGGRTLNSGETIEQHSTSNNSCGGVIPSPLTFDDAKCADTDGDCEINYDETDR